MALMKLQSSSKMEELLLWGKITGRKEIYLPFHDIGLYADYYIAVGYTYSGMYEFPVKKFFWALSKELEFQELPDLNDQHKAAINNTTAYFEGNPKKKLVSLKKEGEGKSSKIA